MAFTVELFPTTIREARRLSEEGCALAAIVRILEGTGHRTKSDTKVSYYVLRKYLAFERGELDSLCTQWETKNSWEQWVEDHLAEADSDTGIEKSVIYHAYLNWSEEQRLEPMSARKAGSWLRSRYKWKNRNGHIVYQGLCLRRRTRGTAGDGVSETQTTKTDSSESTTD